MVIYILLKILLKLQTKIILLNVKIFKGDFLSEFNRSMIISKLIKKNLFFQKIFIFIGKKIPL